MEDKRPLSLGELIQDSVLTCRQGGTATLLRALSKKNPAGGWKNLDTFEPGRRLILTAGLYLWCCRSL